ncbi:hypothetical protein DERP_000125 [Dermatophagoides pteronyssinus]|uniref:Uncharacterized protein n=1 Tax=Dermatophagoides pteronyssinus TaxID=6956 RepID=A0ABQ8IZ96_DERPT|nr:hypothetical protein DERP_000125 [Dermatophagoides pteronyssinus]
MKNTINPKYISLDNTFSTTSSVSASDGLGPIIIIITIINILSYYGWFDQITNDKFPTIKND